MGGELGRVRSLPMLPTGSSLFERLPARAIVVDALAPAVGNGIITMFEDDRMGVLVVRDGGISDAVSIDDTTRTIGDAALALMRRWDAAALSAYRWTDSAMSLLEPLIRGEPCYDDLRLEWAAWPQLLDDLRARGGTFVVELFTPTGRGVTILRGGERVATYSDSHPSLGDPELTDVLATGGVGSIRVLAAETVSPGHTLLGSAAATPPPSGSVQLGHATPHIPSAEDDGGDAMLSALFCAPMEAPEPAPLITLHHSEASATTEARALVPELKLLAQDRLHRSSGPVENVIDVAVHERRSLAWLAERVRVISVRGFMASTFDQLAEDMLALAGRG